MQYNCYMSETMSIGSPETAAVVNKGDVLKMARQWKNERPWWHFGERHARNQIVKALRKDVYQSPLTAQEIKQNTHVAYQTLEHQLGNQNSIQIPQKDSVTGESYVLSFKKELGALVAQEERDGQIISLARITQGGKADVAFDFHGTRYQQKGATFQLPLNSGYPRAATLVFNTLVTVGRRKKWGKT